MNKPWANVAYNDELAKWVVRHHKGERHFDDKGDAEACARQIVTSERRLAPVLVLFLGGWAVLVVYLITMA